MDLGLRGKAAVVSGGSRGIGRAIAERLLREGAAVAICARDKARLDATVAELQAIGPPVIGLVADTGDEAAATTFVDAARSRLGRLDILVNNAGTHLRGTVESIQHRIDVNDLSEQQRPIRDRLPGSGRGASRCETQMRLCLNSASLPPCRTPHRSSMPWTEPATA